MELILTTDRLLLRPLDESDVEHCADLWTDPVVMKYIRWPDPRDVVVREFPAKCQRAGGGCVGIWCVADVASGEKLGTCILLPLPIDRDGIDWSLLQSADMPAGEIEVGYILKQSAWGRGVATEACSRMLKFAFEDTPLEEVVAVTDPDNAASQHVLTKCGLVRQADRRAYNADDVPAFRISKAQWLARQAIG